MGSTTNLNTTKPGIYSQSSSNMVGKPSGWSTSHYGLFFHFKIDTYELQILWPVNLTAEIFVRGKDETVTSFRQWKKIKFSYTLN